MEIIITDQNFEEEIKKAEKPVLVDFFAKWCEPCLMLAPVLEKVAEEFKDEVILFKANLDAMPLFAQKFGVDKIPTVILFKNGSSVSGFTGLRPENEIRQWLEQLL